MKISNIAKIQEAENDFCRQPEQKFFTQIHPAWYFYVDRHLHNDFSQGKEQMSMSENSQQQNDSLIEKIVSGKVQVELAYLPPAIDKSALPSHYSRSLMEQPATGFSEEIQQDTDNLLDPQQNGLSDALTET